jgi:hypothetical protein
MMLPVSTQALNVATGLTPEDSVSFGATPTLSLVLVAETSEQEHLHLIQ